MHTQTYKISSSFMNNGEFHSSQISWLYQVVGPLMELKPKLLAYWNMVPDTIFMSERRNRSHNYARM